MKKKNNEDFQKVEFKNIHVKYHYNYFIDSHNNKFFRIFKKYGILSCLIIIAFVLGFISHDIIIKKTFEKEKLKTVNLLLSNFVSYSQCFEDFILFFLFYDIKNGFYIDVGANDPNIYSVTKAFYERGWNGINIEPLPEKYYLLQKFRPRDINLNIGAGNNEGFVSFMKYGSHGRRSSLILNKNLNNSELIKIKIKRMSTICKKYIPTNIQIQFCKIDVERSEKLVLLGYDFQNYRPKVFCIESLINEKTKVPQYKEWENILANNDYDFVYYYKGNRFYYDKRIKNLKDKFKQLDYFIKIYKK